MTSRRNGATNAIDHKGKVNAEKRYRNAHKKMKKIIDNLESGQSVQSLQTSDYAKY